MPYQRWRSSRASLHLFLFSFFNEIANFCQAGDDDGDGIPDHLDDDDDNDGIPDAQDPDHHGYKIPGV